MKERLLINWNDNWADEMDLEGHFVMDKDVWEQMKEQARKIDYAFTYCVGSNEEIEYKDGEDALKYFTAKSITEEEYKVLERLGLECSGFTGPDFEFDEGWEDDDDDYDSTQPEEEIKFWMNWNTKRAKAKISLSFKEYNREKKVIELNEAGYVVTYTGKYGETWELKA